jgi:hypothetical protein
LPQSKKSVVRPLASIEATLGTARNFLHGFWTAKTVPLYDFAPTGQFNLSTWFEINGFGSGFGGIGSLIVKCPD